MWKALLRKHWGPGVWLKAQVLNIINYKILGFRAKFMLLSYGKSSHIRKGVLSGSRAAHQSIFLCTWYNSYTNSFWTLWAWVSEGIGRYKFIMEATKKS